MMSAKRMLSLLLSATLLFMLAACHKTPQPAAPQTTAPTTQPLPDVTTAAPEDENADPILDDLEFSQDVAVYLGAFETEIFGQLTMFYQDERLVIFDSYGAIRFTLYANSYQPAYEGAPIELVADDVNFDGYTDFYLLYTRGNLNSYYFFWIWNMQERTFKYYLPLSSVPSPSINKETKRIMSEDQTDMHTLITTEYIWQNGDILPIAHGERSMDVTNDGQAPAGPEDVDISLSILDGHILSSVVMKMNENTRTDWIYQIENESIVKLYSDSVDSREHTHRFVFRGVRPGTTTVVLRYANSWSDEYVSQRILNITVNEDRTLKITIIE